MRKSVIAVIMIGALAFLQGCETAKGFKKDVSSFWQNAKEKKSVLHKADAWMQEHLW